MTNKQISRISLAVALAFLSINANAISLTTTVTSNVTGDPDIQIGSADNRIRVAVNSIDSDAFTITPAEGGNLAIYAAGHGMQVAYNNSAVNLGSNETNSLIISTVFDEEKSKEMSYITGVNALFGAEFSMQAKNISISVEGTSDLEARGLAIGSADDNKGTYNKTKATIGSSTTENISIVSNGAKYSAGLLSIRADTTIQAKNILISSDAEGAYGVLVQNSTQDAVAPTDHATLTIKGEKISIQAPNGNGLMAFSNGELTVDGNLTVDANHAIDVRGNSTVNVNTDGVHTTVLDGDIVFETPYTKEDPQGSGNLINAYINVGLHGKDSSWTGRAYQHFKDSTNSAVEVVDLDNGNATFGNVNGFKLAITNGGAWNMTGDSFVNDIEVADGGSVNMQSDAKVLNVDAMNVDNATINMQGGADQKVSVNTLSSKAATLSMNASTEDGKTVQTGQFEVLKSVEDGSDLGIMLTGITSDDIEDAQAAMDSVKDSVVAKGATIEKTIAEGDVNGLITETTSADGTRSTVQTAENTKLVSMKGVNAAALVAWRDEVAYTNQRMEYLRDGGNAYGAWAQVYGGESSYDDGSVDLKTTTVQVGADTAIGDWVAGAAFSYMNGDADMHNGSADTDAYTLSLYASRMFDSGLFVNGLARYGRLSTDATAGNMDGSYDNNAFSIGGNVGYRFTFAEQAFVEPSFGLQYAYVMGDDYTASNGVKVEQDDFDALIASLGARIGFNFAKDAGKIYARASVNYDFMGEIDGTAGNGKAVQDMYVDLGGTWVTYGLGTQFNITDNLSVWGNLDRTTGGEVSTNYMMNAGVRYVF